MPYPMMRTPDICALPVQNIATVDSLLFLWAIHLHLLDALAVIRAWGFTYKTAAFARFFLRRGYWTHSSAEVCLLATSGYPQRSGTEVSILIFSPRREHSGFL